MACASVELALMKNEWGRGSYRIWHGGSQEREGRRGNGTGYDDDDDGFKVPGRGQACMEVSQAKWARTAAAVYSQQEYARTHIWKGKESPQRPHETLATSMKLLQVPHLPMVLPEVVELFLVRARELVVELVSSSRSLRKSMKLFNGNHSDVAVEGPSFWDEGLERFLEEGLKLVLVRCFFGPMGADSGLRV